MVFHRFREGGLQVECGRGRFTTTNNETLRLTKLRKAPCGIGTIIRGSGAVEGYRVAVRGIMAQLR